MTRQPPPDARAQINRLLARLVHCLDQAECDRLEAEIAAMQGALPPSWPPQAVKRGADA